MSGKWNRKGQLKYSQKMIESKLKQLINLHLQLIIIVWTQKNHWKVKNHFKVSSYLSYITK
jgi:hypothetical protein